MSARSGMDIIEKNRAWHNFTRVVAACTAGVAVILILMAIFLT